MNTKNIKFCIFCFILSFNSLNYATALDDYVAAADPSYSWSQTASQADYTTYTNAYTLSMTSQTWRSGSEVSPSVWTHWVTVIVPMTGFKSTALILINGGNIGESAPSISPTDPTNLQYRTLAAATGSIIVELRCVPNQPLQFSDETTTRSEDEIIAYSWDKFLNGGDDYWPAQLPMVKSVVRCMDTIQAFRPAVEHFVLTGGSKRGWTAWLTAAVDTRVTAIAPIVSDLLNLRRSFAHHWSCYGFWADVLSPYEDMGIFDRFEDARTADLMTIVDPYEYRDRLTIPKYIITAAGDDFFVNDSIQFYLDGLIGQTYVRSIPNTNHYLDGAMGEVFANTIVYYDAFLRGSSRPQFTWTCQDDGSIVVQTSATPLEVNLWQADSPAARDFRLVTIGTTWTSTSLTEQSPGVYMASPGIPETGWRAFFVEMVYDYSTPSVGIGAYNYHFTTEIRVVPQIRPFEADFTRDRETNTEDLLVLAQYWMADSPYYDILPRRMGDSVINLADFTAFGIHWLAND